MFAGAFQRASCRIENIYGSSMGFSGIYRVYRNLGELKVNLWDYKGIILPPKRLKVTYSTTRYRVHGIYGVRKIGLLFDSLPSAWPALWAHGLGFLGGIKCPSKAYGHPHCPSAQSGLA